MSFKPTLTYAIYRIEHLSQKPDVNQRLINKWIRISKKL